MGDIKNIIFDVSDVLTMHTYGPEWSNRLLAEKAGVSLQVIKDFFAEYVTVGRLSHGLSLDEFWPQRTVDTGALRLEDVKQSGQRYTDHVVVNPEMIKLLTALQPHYNLFALTNSWKPSHPLKSQLEHYFLAFVQSCDIGKWKPNQDVFEYMIKTYNLIPQETLFVDNSRENVAAAKALRIQAVQFIDAETLREEFKRLLLRFKI